MPDLVTHFSTAYILKLPHRWSSRVIPFYIGAILPDLLSRPLFILFPQSDRIIFSFHTPAVMAVFCLLLAQFFEKRIRSAVRINLLLGIMLHFGLDLLQKQITSSYYWLFPFSWKSFDLGLFWPEDSVWLVPVWIALLVVIEFVFLFRRRKKNPII